MSKYVYIVLQVSTGNHVEDCIKMVTLDHELAKKYVQYAENNPLDYHGVFFIKTHTLTETNLFENEDEKK